MCFRYMLMQTMFPVNFFSLECVIDLLKLPFEQILSIRKTVVISSENEN